MSADTVTMTLSVSTDKWGSEHKRTVEIDREDWAEMDDAEREVMALEQLLLMQGWSWDWEVADDE